MRNLLLTFILLFGTFSVNVYANVKATQIRQLKNQIIEEEIPNCQNIDTYYDRVYCSGKIYNIMDDKLNGVYQSLLKKLSKPQKRKLNKVQMKWIHHRDDTCAKINSDGIVLNLTCSIRNTTESLYYIKEMNHNIKDFDSILQEYKSKK